ncbi:tetratricopeptide repeat protein [Geoalkalibacter halelectricus]|uniref:Tetratricopeptide repeat-containing protein n=1 Tax=Geoalkalibacter halelectricus TaxID=2847045 RepID=A0ABY5ZKU2_9BACT|nr:hypothetical protein [Geoalkalibacter halelectricus]MDO3379654.1 hypothetical protein [Geoalkalibacter halelectricus]UWZ78530.1 hypothetical protein L9S41_12680 [Geoalkalibacter halelectricus]
MTEQTPAADSLAPKFYRLWTPPPGTTVAVGADRTPMSLPQIPLPLHRQGGEEALPDDNAIGSGLFDYLREFPDCPHNRAYAELLRDAFPHYIAEIGSQLAMLDAREVDPPYIRRKITFMRILLLLNPDNAGLYMQLGMAHYQVGMMFSELRTCRFDLLKALAYLQKALSLSARNAAIYNYLGQIDFYLGDYPGAARHWRGIHDQLPEGAARQELARRLEMIERGEVPDHPLIDHFETIGKALAAYRDGFADRALRDMEAVAADEYFRSFYQAPEFYHFLGLCRERCEDPSGAIAAFAEALAIDEDFEPAREGFERVHQQG